ncbi:MAG: hypothetical protein COB50_02355 [Thiotrichales bacterium]|nr:MAG: hypothetical protein COB50_02355 [Thiotrichales bacterium]
MQKDQNQHNEQLVLGVSHRSVVKIEKALEQGADPNMSYRNEPMLTHVFFILRKTGVAVGIARALLERGADLYRKFPTDYNGWDSVFHYGVDSICRHYEFHCTDIKKNALDIDETLQKQVDKVEQDCKTMLALVVEFDKEDKFTTYSLNGGFGVETPMQALERYKKSCQPLVDFVKAELQEKQLKQDVERKRIKADRLKKTEGLRKRKAAQKQYLNSQNAHSNSVLKEDDSKIKDHVRIYKPTSNNKNGLWNKLTTAFFGCSTKSTKYIKLEEENTL